MSVRGAYFDNNATTPLDPEVRQAMLPWLGERVGNPSSAHRFGQVAREAVEAARERLAALLGGRPEEIVWVGSGTEANNAVLAAVGGACRFDGRIVVSALEHPSVEQGARRLEAHGMEVVRVAPGPDGVVAPDAVEAALDDRTRLVALMLASNEIGTLQPVAEVARRSRRRGVPVLCDAVQAVGKVPVAAGELGVDYLTVGAHKLHGPLGAGALWVRAGAPFEPLLVGGGQERRRRAGTENVPAIVGLGRAAELAAAGLEERRDRLAALRDRFERGLAGIPGAIVHARSSPRLPTTSHVAFPGLEGEALMIRLDLAGFAVSTGSACASGVVEPSPTLAAMGVDPAEAHASIRVSFGLQNTPAEVDAFLEVLAREVAALREILTPRVS